MESSQDRRAIRPRWAAKDTYRRSRPSTSSSEQVFSDTTPADADRHVTGFCSRHGSHASTATAHMNAIPKRICALTHERSSNALLVTIVIAGVAVACVLAGLIAPQASAHHSWCHSNHSCPSDHHTYVWHDGAGWLELRRPVRQQYDPARD